MLRNSLIRTFKSWTFPSSITPQTPVFTVTVKNGFLPTQDPIVNLPQKYDHLNKLLDRMSLVQDDGSPGLLAEGKFGDAVKSLPLYDLRQVDDQRLLMALFRDYTFATSAYLLEPCDIMNRKKGTYGRGRSVLPKQLAIPLTVVSEKINAKPFMEYAQSYALYNYKRKDTSKPIEYSNLELIRKFSNLPSEHGFILVHVDMVRQTGEFVKRVDEALRFAASKNRLGFTTALKSINTVMTEINRVMETMWQNSLPEDYSKFRAFIMGTKDQKEMFPDGVIYEGVDEQPRFYRGESGANDSIIPTCDNLLQVTKSMPDNELTAILRDFRTYRPDNHTKWLKYVEEGAKQVGVEEFARGDKDSLVEYIYLLDQVRDFRNRHWMFAKEYIINRSNHPVATGGSPMATWLPNQLSVILEAIQKQSKFLGERYGKVKEIESLLERAAAQQRVLNKDVQTFKAKFAQKA